MKKREKNVRSATKKMSQKPKRVPRFCVRSALTY